MNLMQKSMFKRASTGTCPYKSCINSHVGVTPCGYPVFLVRSSYVMEVQYMFGKIFTLLIFVLGFATLFTSTYAAADDLKGTVIIFHAGSLSVPFELMEKEFEKSHPGVDVQREPAGSLQCARKVSELKKPCDIVATSDYKVIDDILVPNFADYNIEYATNRIVLCFTEKSKNADKITADNWYDILQDKDVVWGYADKDVDPCGYRSLMTMQLAENYYKKPGLYDKLLANCPKENIRPKSEDQISLIQTGNMDYAWEYQSVAMQHKLKYISLPDEINLGNVKFNDYYKQAVVEVAGSKPGSTTKTEGQAIVYGVTLIKDAQNKAAAEAFMAYLLDPKGGLAILEKDGQPPLIPCCLSDAKMIDKVPENLRKFIKAD
jgi:molybdate/tungstate transport system substrate-binding protein